jgi:signal peptidase I
LSELQYDDPTPSITDKLDIEPDWNQPAQNEDGTHESNQPIDDFDTVRNEITPSTENVPVDENWSMCRPSELPEPASPVIPIPVYKQETQRMGLLHPMPCPHADTLWTQTDVPSLKPTVPPIVDFLADEKAKLMQKQPLDSISDTDQSMWTGWKTIWAVTREIGETIILTIIIFFLIQTVIRNFRVVGTSMINNLHDGQYLIIDKISYNPFVTEIIGIGGIQRGDVIVFEPPNRPEDDYVKRVIGLSGETVEVINGQVFINDEPLDEPFRPQPGSYNMPPMTVEAGRLFVLGDNRNNSNDSHNWGTLPIENIVGRAWLSYWPPDEWGFIPRDIPSEEATLKHLLETFVPSANAGGKE